MNEGQDRDDGQYEALLTKLNMYERDIPQEFVRLGPSKAFESLPVTILVSFPALFEFERRKTRLSSKWVTYCEDN